MNASSFRRLFSLPLLLIAFVPAFSLVAQDYKVLVFSKTAAFRHDSITNGWAMIQQLGSSNGFAVDITEDATAFTYTNLSKYAAVVWLSTTGDVLDDNQQAEFQQYIRNSGGYVGIHSASDTEYTWPWYGQLVGSYFSNHPAIVTATLKVADPAHPSTATLPRRWSRTDEWYNFQSNPRGAVHVLATVDETTYSPGVGAMGFDHPISWCHNFDGGRAWYTFQSNPRGAVHVLATVDETTYSPGVGAMGFDHPISWCHNFDGGRAWYTALG